MSGSGSVGQHPRFQRLERYLRDKATAGSLAGRQDIDPIELKGLLPYVNLFDVVQDADRLRFRFRLLGTAQADALGADFTGRFIDDVFDERAAKPILKAMLSVVSTGSPHHAEVSVPLPDRAHIRFERTIFPLASDGQSVDMLIAAYVFLPDADVATAMRMVG